MNKDYLKIRKIIEDVTPFKDLKECEKCEVACNTTTNRVFLFKLEVDNYPKEKIIKVGNHFFIELSDYESTHCPFLIIDAEKKKRCSIHKSKPLSCAINPVSVHGINSEPFWIFDGECPLSSKKEVIEKAKRFVDALEKKLEKPVIKELVDISKEIEQNQPFKKEDIIPLKKILFRFH